jgi:hypothetical protein
LRHPQDLTLLDYGLLSFPPSQLAAGALTLAMHTYGLGPAPVADTLRLAGYAPADMAAVSGCLLHLHQNAAWCGAPSVRELLAPLTAKYGRQSWCCAALVPPLQALRPEWFV